MTFLNELNLDGLLLNEDSDCPAGGDLTVPEVEVDCDVDEVVVAITTVLSVVVIVVVVVVVAVVWVGVGGGVGDRESVDADGGLRWYLISTMDNWVGFRPGSEVTALISTPL